MADRVSVEKYLNLVDQIGRSAVHALFPRDIEVYLIAFELTDSEDKTIDYFTFPVMPKSILKNEPKRTAIRPTASGISVLSSTSVIPQNIQLKGDFGRTFKILIGKEPSSTIASSASIQNGKYKLAQVNEASRGVAFSFGPFNAGIKTGYGATKILQAIIDKSNGVDSKGQPFKLYFYNLALGESYLVAIPPQGVNFSQTLQKNMIWEYNLNISVLSDLEALGPKSSPSSLVGILSRSVIQQGASIVAQDVSRNILSLI